MAFLIGWLYGATTIVITQLFPATILANNPREYAQLGLCYYAEVDEGISIYY